MKYNLECIYTTNELFHFYQYGYVLIFIFNVTLDQPVIISTGCDPSSSG